MFCRNCGKEIPDGTNFCPECGISQTEQKCPNCGEPIDINAQYCMKCGKSLVGPQISKQKKNTKKKKPFYKRVWFWVIIAILLIFFLIPNTGTSGSDRPTEPVMSEAEYKAKCVEISYSDLARNPDAKKCEYFKFTGEVIQVAEYSKTVNLRVNVTPVYYSDDHSGDPLYYEDTIYVVTSLTEDGNRILEGDVISVYGVCTGLYTYKSVLGAQVSIPGIDAEYWELIG